MRKNIKNFIKLITPPVLLNLTNRMRKISSKKYYGQFTEFENWEAALEASTGYDSEIILEKTKEALMKVKNGSAVYERDSVLFDQIQYSWPVLAGLMWVAAKFGGRLNVLDFGGSLGTSYYQNRVFLTSLPDVRWNIVEQEHYVETGRSLLQNDHLFFYKSIKDCLADTRPNIALLSGVLPVIPKPFEILEDLKNFDFEYVIIDRTPFWEGEDDKLSVLNVSPDIYPASFPIWIFSKSRFLTLIKQDWQVIEEFTSLDKHEGTIKVEHCGFLLQRKAT